MDTRWPILDAVDSGRPSVRHGLWPWLAVLALACPASADDWPAWRAALAAHAADVLAGALPPGTVIRRSHRVGGERVDVAVLATEPGRRLVLALDVGDSSTPGVGDIRAARLAGLGVSEYWRLEVSRDCDRAGIAMLRIASSLGTDRNDHRWTMVASRNPDLLLRIAALPSARVAIDDLLPEDACPRAPTSGVVPARRRAPAEVVGFVTDGSHSAPSLVFEAMDGDAAARRLAFTATSDALRTAFDPTTSGIAVTIAGPYDGEQVIDVVLAAGGSWSRTGGKRPSWTYHDAAGTVGGITDVIMRTLDHGALGWEVRGTGTWSVSLPEIERWGRIGVRVGLPVDAGERGLTAYFLTGGPRPQCVEPASGTITCRAALPPPEACVALEPDALLRCGVEQLARAEHRFFASHGRYFSGACDDLALPQATDWLDCRLLGTPHGFQVFAAHRDMTFRIGCRWDSQSEAENVRCS